MRTKNGIYYVLEESEYRHTENGLTFVFSSKLYLDKFLQKKESNREYINSSLSKRFDIAVKVDVLADISLYGKIEKRGYLIVNKEGFNICQRNNLTFVGEKVILTSSNV